MTARGRPRAFDRDEALDKAMRVFWHRGYEGTSLSDLTTAMGIASPSLYAAFGGKEALFREAVERYRERYGQPWREAPTAFEEVGDWLRTSARRFVDQNRPRGCMVVLSGINCTDQNQPVRDFLAVKRRENLELLRARLERGVADGDVPENADLDGMVRFYGTVLHGLSIQALDGAEEDELVSVVENAMACWPRFTHEEGVAPA
ncbi:TetR/AcrR family transcriptional regulator [Amycolatopsis acididurans]|nr:TetR/AcrR family transcriptional regulator [Amycolatopsis acididurans]